MIEVDGRTFVGGTKVHMDVTEFMEKLGNLVQGLREAKGDESVLSLLSQKAELEGEIAYFRLQKNEYEMLVKEAAMLEATAESAINDSQRSISLAEKKIRMV